MCKAAIFNVIKIRMKYPSIYIPTTINYYDDLYIYIHIYVIFFTIIKILEDHNLSQKKLYIIFKTEK